MTDLLWPVYADLNLIPVVIDPRLPCTVFSGLVVLCGGIGKDYQRLSKAMYWLYWIDSLHSLGHTLFGHNLHILYDETWRRKSLNCDLK